MSTIQPTLVPLLRTVRRMAKEGQHVGSAMEPGKAYQQWAVQDVWHPPVYKNVREFNRAGGYSDRMGGLICDGYTSSERYKTGLNWAGAVATMRTKLGTIGDVVAGGEDDTSKRIARLAERARVLPGENAQAAYSALHTTLGAIKDLCAPVRRWFEIFG